MAKMSAHETVASDMLQLCFDGVHYMEPSCWVQIQRCCLLSNRLRSIIQQGRTITPLLLQCSQDWNQKKLVASWASVTLKNCIITIPTASFRCHTELINLSNLWATRTCSTSSEHTYTQLMVPSVSLRSWDHVNHTLTKQSWKCKHNSWAPINASCCTVCATTLFTAGSTSAQLLE